MLSAPVKAIYCESNVNKKFITFHHLLQCAIVVKEYVSWLWYVGKNILHEVLVNVVEHCDHR